MHWNPDHLMEDFNRVAAIAGVSLAPDAIMIDQRPAPHVPPKAPPPGRMAVYVFSFGPRVLKVGKVGPNSAARYTAQHYNAGSAKSTLSASLIKHGECIGVAGLNDTNVSGWIRENTERVNFILDAALGIHVLNLIEAFLQCRLQPEFEGFTSQRVDKGTDLFRFADGRFGSEADHGVAQNSPKLVCTNSS